MKNIFIVANWKMNPQTLTEAKKLFSLIKKGIKENKNEEIIICPPFIFLSCIQDLRFTSKQASSNIKIGSQDCFWENPPTGGGAFTGEVSPKMLKELGVEYVIIGHSERRKMGESNQIISKKIKAALSAGLKPILCIDKTSQIPKNAKEIIIAYEPLFAIGTGKPCTIERAKKTRGLIKHNQVLYGGSVNSQNALDYIKKAGFQGLLIGGASLDPKEFIKIINLF